MCNAVEWPEYANIIPPNGGKFSLDVPTVVGSSTILFSCFSVEARPEENRKVLVHIPYIPDFHYISLKLEEIGMETATANSRSNFAEQERFDIFCCCFYCLCTSYSVLQCLPLRHYKNSCPATQHYWLFSKEICWSFISHRLWLCESPFSPLCLFSHLIMPLLKVLWNLWVLYNNATKKSRMVNWKVRNWKLKTLALFWALSNSCKNTLSWASNSCKRGNKKSG